MTMTNETIVRGAVGCIAVLLGLWTASQWIASTLGHHPRLGSPLLTVLGWRLYAPWQVLTWWLQFGRAVPRVFDTAGLIAISGAVVAGALGIGGAAWRASRRAVVTTYGSARWAVEADIRKAQLANETGVMIGQFGQHYLRDAGSSHVLAVAPTRSGKGTGLVVPTLLSWTGSAVIHDIKGENWDLTSGWRHIGTHCLRFDPTNPNSARFNPLLEVRHGANEVRDVQNIADILIDPEGGRPFRDHWQTTAHSLLSGAILHVLYAEPEKTLANVARLLSDPTRPIGRTLWAMLTTNHLGTEDEPQAHPAVAQYAAEILNKVPNERSGVISTAISLLSLYRDPLVAAATATSDFRISDLVEGREPISLYLVVPPSDLSRTRPLIRLMLNQIARRITEGHELDGQLKKRRKLLLMLDEFPALGRLEFFEQGLAFMAGYGVRAYLIAQSLNQLEKAYGVNSSIVDNCHVRIAFAANDERTAKRLSDMLGTKTELRQQRNLAGKRLAPWLAHTSLSEQEVARPLLTPGEVMQLPSNEALVFVNGCPPIRAHKIRYYEDAQLQKLCLPALTQHRCAIPGFTAAETWPTEQRPPHAGLAARSAAMLTEAAQKELGIEAPALFSPPYSQPRRAARDTEFIDLALRRPRASKNPRTQQNAMALDRQLELLP